MLWQQSTLRLEATGGFNNVKITGVQVASTMSKSHGFDHLAAHRSPL
jgi:hypothetical protein